jgi:hypothetical protein
MTTCIICRFPTEVDDAMFAVVAGRCVCLRCFARETGTERPMPKPLRCELAAALAEMEPA